MANRLSRRETLRYSGATAMGMLSAGFAGCSSLGGGGGGEYPSQDITYIVPYAEGGGTDTWARQIVPLVADQLDTSIAIENIDGAAGMRGLGELHAAEPNGYTIGAVTPDTEGVAALVNEPDFDLTELTGICQYGLNSWVLLARSDLELEGMDDMADRYADGDLELIGGLPEGSNLHILALIMQEQYGIEWSDYVGYDGTGPISQAVLANEIPVGIGSDTGFASAAEDEDAEVIAVFASGGSNVFPDVPSVTDQGYGNVDYIGQINRAMAGPPDLSEDIVNTVASATESALETDEAQEWADETGNTIRFEEGNRVEELFEQVQTEVPENVDIDEITS